MPEQDKPETGLAKSAGQPIVLQRQQDTFAPRTLSEAITFANLVAKSGMAPKGYEGKPEAIIVAIQMGMEVGLQPLQALQNIAVINGRPSIWGDGALALVKTHPEFEWIKEDDIETITKNKKAVCVIKRRNQPEVKMTFSMEDATTAGLKGKQGPWSTYPGRMMQMRARGFAIRDAFPDALKGIITAEEAMDLPPAIDGGRAEFVETKAAAPDPMEQPVSKEEATALWKLVKATREGLHADEITAQYKQALKDIAGVESSAAISKGKYPQMMEWAAKKPVPVEEAKVEEQPAEVNMDAEPPEEGR